MSPALTLRLPRVLAPFCDGQTTLTVAGRDVRTALDDAIARHPLLRTHLLDERGDVREHIHVFLNDTDVRQDLSAPTRDGDELYVLQAMSGGAGFPPSPSPPAPSASSALRRGQAPASASRATVSARS